VPREVNSSVPSLERAAGSIAAWHAQDQKSFLSGQLLALRAAAQA